MSISCARRRITISLVRRCHTKRMQPSITHASRTGLILTGGGARAAYQVGVLKAIAELLPRGSPCPFPVITGTSAGAVSAIVLASNAAHFRRAVLAIDQVWRNFEVSQVFKADTASMLRAGLHWMLASTGSTPATFLIP